MATPRADGRELAVVLERLGGVLRRLGAAGGLSLSAASTLHRVSRDGPTRICDLADAEGLTQPGMTQLVTRLADQRLVERVADPADRRAVLVRVTAAGRDVLTRRRAARSRVLAELLGTLSVRDRAAIVRALPALHALCTAADVPDARRSSVASARPVSPRSGG